MNTNSDHPRTSKVSSLFIRPPRQHFGYILRFWETRSLPPDPPKIWRFSLEDVETGERLGFADLDRMVAFLREQIDVDEHVESDVEEKTLSAQAAC